VRTFRSLSCVGVAVSESYPGPRRIGHQIPENRSEREGYRGYGDQHVRGQTKPDGARKALVMCLRLVTTSTISSSLTWACTSALSGFVQLVRTKLLRAQNSARHRALKRRRVETDIICELEFVRTMSGPFDVRTSQTVGLRQKIDLAPILFTESCHLRG
jgi:hypothetical protein